MNSASSSKNPASMDEELKKNLISFWEHYMEIKREILLGIVITKFAPKENFQKIQMLDGFYIFIQKPVWNELSKAFKPSETGLLGLFGIPVYKNDQLAFELLTRGEFNSESPSTFGIERLMGKYFNER